VNTRARLDHPSDALSARPHPQDVVDSDFDAPEDGVGSGDDGGAAAGAARPARRSRTGKYVDPALRKRRGSSGAAAKPPAKRAKPAAPALGAAVDRTSLRKSTKAARDAADAARDAADAVRAEKRAKARERGEAKVPEKVLTQAEMLAEAEVTATENEKDLARLLKLEEERKREAAPPPAEDVPRMVVRDRDGKTTVSFTDDGADAKAAMFPHATLVEREGSGAKVAAGSAEVDAPAK
jgi:YL1 nuclear protein